MLETLKSDGRQTPSEGRDDIKIVSQLLIIITNSLEDQHSPENILSSLNPTSYIPKRIRPLMQYVYGQ